MSDAPDGLMRVTSLLRWAGVTKPIPNTAVVRAAMERGTAVHEWSLRIEEAARVHSQPHLIGFMPRRLQGYGRAVAAFTRRYEPHWDERETRKDDPVLGLTGCPDRVGVMQGERVVVDFKTGHRYAWHRLQLALYAILIERVGVTHDQQVDRAYRLDKRMGVYLEPEGTYRLVTYRKHQDILDAWSIITRYRNEVTRNDDNQ
jgi:hypothetical protein